MFSSARRELFFKVLFPSWKVAFFNTKKTRRSVACPQTDRTSAERLQCPMICTYDMTFFLTTFNELLKTISIGFTHTVTKYNTTSLLTGSVFKIALMSTLHGSPVFLLVNKHTTLCVGTLTKSVGACVIVQWRDTSQCFDPAPFWPMTLIAHRTKTLNIIRYPFILKCEKPGSRSRLNRQLCRFD